MRILFVAATLCIVTLLLVNNQGVVYDADEAENAQYADVIINEDDFDYDAITTKVWLAKALYGNGNGSYPLDMFFQNYVAEGKGLYSLSGVDAIANAYPDLYTGALSVLADMNKEKYINQRDVDYLLRYMRENGKDSFIGIDWEFRHQLDVAAMKFFTETILPIEQTESDLDKYPYRSGSKHRQEFFESLYADSDFFLQEYIYDSNYFIESNMIIELKCKDRIKLAEGRTSKHFGYVGTADFDKKILENKKTLSKKEYNPYYDMRDSFHEKRMDREGQPVLLEHGVI